MTMLEWLVRFDRRTRESHPEWWLPGGRRAFMERLLERR